MAPSKATMLSTLIETSSADEDAPSDIDMMPTPDSQPENRAPPKRKAGRTKAAVVATKATKTKAVSRRVSSGAATKSKSRKALAERTNVPNDGDETEEVDDFDEELQNLPTKPARRGKAPNVAKDEPATARTRTAKPTGKSAGGGKKTGRSKQISSEREVLESQPDAMEIEQTEFEDVTVAEPAPARQTKARQPLAPQLSTRARSTSRQPDLYSRHRRAGSASDTERAGEPALRRKLGDITRKFENLELRYRNLKEVGSNESQSNFDKLKKSTDQRARDQDEIIASLKKELAAQKSLTTESKSLREKNATLQADNQRLTSEVKTLSSSLSSLQNEVKILQAKLSTSRNNTSDMTTTSRTMPGSAAKARGTAVAKAESEYERARIMQMKEDLYSDLTGLMIHNIKRMEEEDVFDCIQTGRNGTLRFHLSVSHPDSKVTATPGTAYEEEEFAYAPLLDEKNDRQLLEILPDYLTEEIVFPRPSAARFYQKIVECMSRKFEE